VQLDGQQALNASVFCSVNDNASAQVALLLFRFRAGDVAQLGPIAFDFPGSGHLEAFLGARVGLHFRHINYFF
jgi:hypothetical protein